MKNRTFMKLLAAERLTDELLVNRMGRKNPDYKIIGPDNVEKAYLAAYVDGEGCLSCTWSKNQVALTFEATYRPYIRAIGHAYGASVLSRKQKAWRSTVYAHIQGEGLKRLLHDIYPYVKEKRDQVRMMLGIMAGRNSLGRGKKNQLARANLLRWFDMKLKEARR